MSETTTSPAPEDKNPGPIRYETYLSERNDTDLKGIIQQIDEAAARIAVVYARYLTLFGGGSSPPTGYYVDALAALQNARNKVSLVPGT